MTSPEEERKRQLQLMVERAVSCGKRCYFRKGQAWRAAKSSKLDLVPYECLTCGFWHLTKRNKSSK